LGKVQAKKRKPHTQRKKESPKQAVSSEGKNYKFYEDIVSFEDGGGSIVEDKEKEYQLIGDDLHKEYVNQTTAKEKEDSFIPVTLGNTTICICTRGSRFLGFFILFSICYIKM
jgi:hypothetical protein